MRNVYISFLGLGNYQETVYKLDGQHSPPTRFVQTAEQHLLGRDVFDVIYIVATVKSAELHFSALQEELVDCRARVELIKLNEVMTEAGQWGWFEQIFSVIKPGDTLCVDLTHGYRSIPIIFSTAINFLQKTKNVQVTHVFYGAYEQNRQTAPLVDMRSFFDINIWADAVTRLTRDADARGIVEATTTTGQHQFSELADNAFTGACTGVTARIKNIDVNNISDEVERLLDCIGELKTNSSPAAAMLLEMVKEKFASLATGGEGNPDKNGYTIAYFRMQLDLARLLLDHGLFMQGFTVMREWLGSLVMLHFEQEGKVKADKRRKRISYYSGIFFNMLQFKQEKWNFSGQEKDRDRVLPFYNTLKKHGVLDPLIEVEPLPAKELSAYRNGFDHAWLGKSGMKQDLEKKGAVLLETLEKVLRRLQASGLLNEIQS